MHVIPSIHGRKVDIGLFTENPIFFSVYTPNEKQIMMMEVRLLK